MKKIDYIELPIVPPAQQEMHLDKVDDTELPVFTKEVPRTVSKETTAKSTKISYTWGKSLSNSIKISSIEFRNDESFENLSKLSILDGEDTAIFTHNSSLYIIRKTAAAIARSVFIVYARIKSVTESIVGYFKTLFGNSYLISKIEAGSWSFDPQLAQKNTSIRLLTPSLCTSVQKDRLVDLIAKKLSSLHGKQLLFGPFTLRNFILTDATSYFTDLRNLRLSRKRSLLVIDFKNAIKSLFSLGIATPENLYPAIAAYSVANEAACAEWYQEKSGGSADLSMITHALEEEIIG